MTDLSLEAAAKYWHEYEDPIIYRVVTFLDSVEDWTLDGDPKLEKAIEKLGKELDDIKGIDLAKIDAQDKLIRLVANVKSGRGLRLLHAVHTAIPGGASKILARAEETTKSRRDPAGIFLKRNIAFERLRLLSRVFSQYRLKLISRALEGGEE